MGGDLTYTFDEGWSEFVLSLPAEEVRSGIRPSAATRPGT